MIGGRTDGRITLNLIKGIHNNILENGIIICDLLTNESLS
jgi:hypothetical protein